MVAASGEEKVAEFEQGMAAASEVAIEVPQIGEFVVAAVVAAAAVAVEPAIEGAAQVQCELFALYSFDEECWSNQTLCFVAVVVAVGRGIGLAETSVAVEIAADVGVAGAGAGAGVGAAVEGVVASVVADAVVVAIEPSQIEQEQLDYSSELASPKWVDLLVFLSTDNS